MSKSRENRNHVAIDRERKAAIKHLREAVRIAESWIHDQLDGTGLLEDALTDIQPARDFLDRIDRRAV